MKKYCVNVWDVTFCKVDEDGKELLNEDGTVKLFHAPKMDYSHISDYVEEDDLVVSDYWNDLQ
tara:strand:+ start:27 stop:215 length:189 start_codon:yes stop_codon:yes gene_type:complete